MPERELQGGWSGVADDVVIIIPTLNAGKYLDKQIAALGEQGIPASSFLIIDSCSTDDTVQRYSDFGAEVVSIDRKDFNHGGTRRFAVTLRPDAKFIIMMTQDALPSVPGSLLEILKAFDDPNVGMAYGRQLPRPEAGAIERHARLQNYPPVSEVRTKEDVPKLGAKVAFCSDSFAAYRRTALEEVGNFPQDILLAEDQVIAGKMILEGWSVAYCANAPVVHSHGYTIAEEFYRYFDLGVFHARDQWLIEAFGRAESEGLKFVRSELAYLRKHDPGLIPSSLLRTFTKYLAYQLGLRERSFSLSMKRRLSMQPFYWRNQQNRTIQ